MTRGCVAWLFAASMLAAPAHLEGLRARMNGARGGAARLAVRAEFAQEAARAHASGDPLAEAYALAGLAMLADLSGQYDAAEKGLDRAAEAARAGAEPLFHANLALWFAQEHFREGQPNRAVDWGRRAAREFAAAGDLRQRVTALQLVWRITPPSRPRALLEELVQAAQQAADPRQMAEVQVEQGEALRADGRLGEAMTILREASRQLEAVSAWSSAAGALVSLARTYASHGQSGEALASMRHALELARRTGDESVLMSTQQELGAALAADGRIVEASPMLEQVRAYVMSDAAPRNLRVRAVVLAVGFLMTREYRQAADVAERIQRDFPRRAPLANDWILSSAYYRLGRDADAAAAATRGLARAGDQQADARAKLYYWRACALDRLGRIAEAANDMTQAARMVDSMRSGLFPEDEWKRAFADAWRPLANRAIDLLWRAGRPLEALDTAEQFRARAFLDLMASRGAAARGPNAAMREPTLLSSVLSKPASRTQLARFAASHQDALLSYWVHPSAVYIWVLPPDGEIQGVRVPIDQADLTKLVSRARAFSYKPDRAAWRELYRILIGPVRAWLPNGQSRLTVLPDDVLWQLPFGALQTPAGPYLLEEFALRSVPAAALILQSARPPNPAGVDGRFVLIGAPNKMTIGPHGRPLPALPAAEHELGQIAELAPAGRVLLTGSLARKARASENLAGARVLHFATHAIIVTSQPFQSFLALSEGEKLTVGELYDFRLTADLVLLSACQSGSGTVSADGLLGFTRAFLYAGAESVIAPVWDIADTPTVRLIEEFYRRYTNGVSKIEALREAQLRVLRDLRAGRIQVVTAAGLITLPESPVLWAGFVLQGAP